MGYFYLSRGYGVGFRSLGGVFGWVLFIGSFWGIEIKREFKG